jgi:murein L,D-transpeptidase YcbB/YkuD
MPATGHELARRAFLMALAAPLLADTRQEILDLITELASALSEGNGLAFLDHIDRAMPDYQKLEQSILALTEQNEVSAAIDILKQEGDDRTQTVELDWLMQIRSREDSGPIERRRETVKCRAERKKKNWKIVSLDPIALFAPPAVR